MSTPLNSISIDCGAPIVWWLWNEGENLARIHCGTPFRCCKDPLHVCRAKRFLRCAVWIHSYSCGQKEPLTLSLYPPSRGRRFYMKGQGQQERWVFLRKFLYLSANKKKGLYWCNASSLVNIYEKFAKKLHWPLSLYLKSPSQALLLRVCKGLGRVCNKYVRHALCKQFVRISSISLHYN